MFPLALDRFRVTIANTRSGEESVVEIQLQPDGLGDLAAFAGVRGFASRRGCVLIAVRAARACLSG